VKNFYLKFTGIFDNFDSFRPRAFGQFPTTDNATFPLFGRGNAQTEAEIGAVQIFPPRYCEANFPQVFCSEVATQGVRECSASLGSPVTSTNSLLMFGFLISEGCRISGDRLVLNYHSVGDFREWLDKVSGAKTTAEISFVLILSAVWINVKNLL
jgi:hypothetical protein